jgi:hypothetical protein
MKKVILTAAAVFAFGFANAQDDKGGFEGLATGDLYLSGALGINSNKSGEFKSNNFTIAPGVGYMMTDNLALEGSVGYTSIKQENGVFEQKNSGFQIVGGVKYFFTPAEKFSLSVGGNISYGSFKSEAPDFMGTTSLTTKQIGINVPVGLHYFVSNNFALTTTWAGLGYATNDNGGNGAEKSNSFGLRVDLSAVGFGLIYKL